MRSRNTPGILVFIYGCFEKCGAEVKSEDKADMEAYVTYPGKDQRPLPPSPTARRLARMEERSGDIPRTLNSIDTC